MFEFLVSVVAGIVVGIGFIRMMPRNFGIVLLVIVGQVAPIAVMFDLGMSGGTDEGVIVAIRYFLGIGAAVIAGVITHVVRSP